ncbi:unnamed protein product [Ectocarpus sp. 12 AP-2014]
MYVHHHESHHETQNETHIRDKQRAQHKQQQSQNEHQHPNPTTLENKGTTNTDVLANLVRPLFPILPKRCSATTDSTRAPTAQTGPTGEKPNMYFVQPLTTMGDLLLHGEAETLLMIQANNNASCKEQQSSIFFPTTTVACSHACKRSAYSYRGRGGGCYA